MFVSPPALGALVEHLVRPQADKDQCTGVTTGNVVRAGPVGEGLEVRLAGRAHMWIHEGHPRTPKDTGLWALREGNGEI